jgi:excisionase family DNA binding protein
MEQDGELMTLKETTHYLRIGRSTLYRMMEKGLLVGYKVGSHWRFFRRDVKAQVMPPPLDRQIDIPAADSL